MARKRGFIESIIIAADTLPAAEFRAGIEAGLALLRRRDKPGKPAAETTTKPNGSDVAQEPR